MVKVIETQHLYNLSFFGLITCHLEPIVKCTYKKQLRHKQLQYLLHWYLSVRYCRTGSQKPKSVLVMRKCYWGFCVCLIYCRLIIWEAPSPSIYYPQLRAQKKMRCWYGTQFLELQLAVSFFPYKICSHVNSFYFTWVFDMLALEAKESNRK